MFLSQDIRTDDIMISDFKRVFSHAWEFYNKRKELISLFSIPFIAAFLIPIFVATPSYLAIGSVYIRTGSIPDMDVMDIVITALAYLVSVFLISEAITTLNLVIKEKRTRTQTRKEILSAMGRYTSRIFAVYIILLLIMAAFQILTYGSSLQEIIYPIAILVISLATFYVPAAIVIDERDTLHAIGSSIKHVMERPKMIAMWILLGLISLSVLEAIFFALLGTTTGSYVMLLLNSIFIIPFLIILQSHMYMEKYPLSK